jgi:hypothetical protein
MGLVKFTKFRTLHGSKYHGEMFLILKSSSTTWIEVASKCVCWSECRYKSIDAFLTFLKDAQMMLGFTKRIRKELVKPTSLLHRPTILEIYYYCYYYYYLDTELAHK